MGKKKKSSETPRYRKLFPMFWRDAGVRSLSTQEKLIATYCLTSHQTNRIGLFSFSVSLAAEDLGMVPETFAKGFANVCETLNWVFDNEGRCLFIPTWWKWNCPEGVNVMKGCLRDFCEVPESYLCQQFTANEKHLPADLRETLRERFRNLPETLPNPGAGTGAGTGTGTGTGAGKQDIGNRNGTVPNRFSKPTVVEVAEYASGAGLTIDAGHFIDFYESKGWRVGKNPMKDWRAAVRNWCRSPLNPKPPVSRVATGADLENWTPYGDGRE